MNQCRGFAGNTSRVYTGGSLFEISFGGGPVTGSLFERLRADDARAQLEEISRRVGLAKLYFIRFVPPHALFGARGALADRALLESELEGLLAASGIDSVYGEKVLVKVALNPQEEVEAVLEEIQPYIQSDGGYIGVVSADEATGTVVLSLQGACSGCSHSVFTLRAGVERLLQSSLPWVANVTSDADPSEPDFGFRIREEWEKAKGGEQ